MANQITSSIPGAVLGFQAVLNTAFGVFGLLQPSRWRAQLDDSFDGSVPSGAAYTTSLQLLNMGIFGLLVATKPDLHRKAIVTRLGLHAVTVYIFWTTSEPGAKMRSMAMVDGAFAVINAVTLALM